MKKNRFIVLCVVLSLTLLLCSCGGDTTESSKPKTSYSVAVDGNSAGRPLTNMDYEDPNSFHPSTPIVSETDAPQSTAPTASKTDAPQPSTPTVSETDAPQSSAPTASETDTPQSSAPTASETDTPQSTAPTVLKPIAPNEYYNPNNAILEEGQVTIRPRYVRWEGNVLVADCFVINGFSSTIFNINVDTLRLSNREGLIADAYFGTLANLSLDPGEYVVWTFRYSADCISALNADLNYLQCYSSVSYNY